tara:strand:+ start:160 stop:687 length:528 start_codon:yes stop_codon:yes gene_type:complete
MIYQLHTHYYDFLKYRKAFDFIKLNKPKLVVEYGTGESTYYLYQCLQELNYGGRLIAYEDSEEWYNEFSNVFPEYKEVVKLVDIVMEDKTLGYVSYNHNIEEIEDVGLVVLDGPDYRVHLTDTNHPSNVTTNIEKIIKHTNKPVHYFIDGRRGCVNYYNKILDKKYHIVQPKEHI